MRFQSILPVLLPALFLGGGPAAAATLNCRIAELCEGDSCAAPDKAAGELSLTGFDGAAPELTYRGETIGMSSVGAADAKVRRWSGRTATGEIQSFAWKTEGGDFIAVTVFEGATTAKATGNCGGQ